MGHIRMNYTARNATLSMRLTPPTPPKFLLLERSERRKVSEQFDFVTDAELIRRLGLPEKVGRTALRELDKQSKARRQFPQPDPLFGNRRFWPAVKQWLLDYKSIRQPMSTMVPWEENFESRSR